MHNVNEGVRVENVSRCLLCGAQGYKFYKGLRDRLFTAPGSWSLFRCPQCSLIWLNPRPVPEEIRKVYATYYTHSVKEQRPRLSYLRKRIKETLLAVCFGYNGLLNECNPKWVGAVLRMILPLKEIVGSGIMWLDGSRGGKLLDIGCGGGRFLARMRDLGWEVMGVDPDVQAAKIAWERFGILIVVGNLQDTGFPDNFFDAITINHVIDLKNGYN